jgi:hypothetical protein
MSDNRKPSMEKLVIYLILGVVSLDILASQLQLVTPYLVVLALVVIVLRLVFFHTRRW